MDKPSPSMRDLARRLLAASQSTTVPHIHEAVVAIEKLRMTLTKFAGADGFASLLRRALVLASAEAPALHHVKIGAGGTLDGFEMIVAGSDASEAAVAITARLLGLLVTFIGEPLTLRLVRTAWPDTSLDDEHSRIEANP